MGKKKSSGNAYTSKGQRPNVAKNTRKSMRRDYMSNTLLRRNNQIAAWEAGKNVMLTVPNNGADVKKTPFVRVNARLVWGTPGHGYSMKQTSE
jgi:hypothetical protein